MEKRSEASLEEKVRSALYERSWNSVPDPDRAQRIMQRVAEQVATEIEKIFETGEIQNERA